MRRGLLAPLSFLVLSLPAGPGAAQTPLTIWRAEGSDYDQQVGLSVGAAGDLDGDGRGDFIVAESDGDHKKFRILLGPGQSLGCLYGDRCIAAGDIDGDGSQDLLLYRQGFSSHSIRLVSGADLSLIDSISVAQPVVDLVAPGDMNGDGYDDVAMVLSDRVAVISGRNHSEIFSIPGPTQRVAAPGDVDADGVPDLLLVPANAPHPGGTARVVSGRDGSLVHEFTGDQPGDALGERIGIFGDLDGDGRADLLIAARPYTRVYSGCDGAVLLEIFHTGVRSIGGGDINGDGHLDLVVNQDPGGLRIISGRDGSTIYQRPRASSRSAVSLEDKLAIVADADGDGMDDILIGSPYSENSWGENDAGVATLLSGRGYAELQARNGNVDLAGSGTQADVLFVNGSPGSGVNRQVVVRKSDGLVISLINPPATTGPFPHVIYVWFFDGFPPPWSANPLRHGAGAMSLPSPLMLDSSPGPLPDVALDAIGRPRALAPAGVYHISVPMGPGVIQRVAGILLGPRTVMVFQGIVPDPASTHGAWAITNCVTVRLALL